MFTANPIKYPNYRRRVERRPVAHGQGRLGLELRRVRRLAAPPPSASAPTGSNAATPRSSQHKFRDNPHLGLLTPPPGDPHGGWDADSVTFSTVLGPGIHRTVRFPMVSEPEEPKTVRFPLYVRLSGPPKNSLGKFPRISERCDSRYVFPTFAILGTKRVQIGKFINRGCL